MNALIIIAVGLSGAAVIGLAISVVAVALIKAKTYMESLYEQGARK